MTGVAELKTLLVCDLVDSTKLVERLGDERAAAVFRRLDEQTRSLIDRWRGREIDKTDGFLLLFDRPINAVRFAAGYQAMLEALTKEMGIELSARVGIHLGEVVIRENPGAEVARGAKPVEVEGLAKAVAARLMSLARARQTLLSRAVYDVARRSTVGGVENGTPLEWRAYGAYQLKGVTEPLEVFEVGPPGGLLTAPADSEKAHRIGRESRPGILVLPFEDLSPDADTGYISHGLADEIISSLSGLEALRVISRSAAVQLKESGKDTASLAAELGVDYALEGTVQRAGPSLLISTRLLRPERGELVWGKSFRGDLQALFDIEQTISESVVGALRVRLTATETERLKTRPIPDVRAYEYYLRAKQQVYSFTEDALDRALHYLEKGTGVIGENVQIYAAMGYVYWQYVNLGVKSDPAYLDKARECAERIRALDPHSPEADRVLGLVTIHAKGDIQDAVRHLKAALEGNRSDPDALFWLALLYGFVGRASSGYPLAERLLEIDPLAAIIQAIPPTLAMLDGDFDRACALFAKAHQMEPENPAINFVYSQALAMAGRGMEACTLLDLIERDAPNSFYHGLGSVFRAALRGDREMAHAALVQPVEDGARADMQYSWALAQAFSLLSETESSVHWLENSVKQGFSNYPIIAELDPLLKGVRKDAGFGKVARTARDKWQAFEV
jgi:TolB-like protein/class 3 adenylate cyclase/tetratricopeptide (TPR) repeat protein